MTQLKSIKTLLAGILAFGAAAASPVASAVTVTWTDWTNITGTTAVGTMGGVTVTVTATSGTMNGVSQTGSGTNYWTQPAPGPAAYTSGTVSNAPTPNEQVGLSDSVTINVVFSSPVNLYMALLSVGRDGLAVTYDFDQSFMVDSEGRGYWGDGSYTLGAGDTITGRELHGVLRFTSPVSSLTFTTNPNEFWHAFTFASVPEPGVLALLGLGLLGVGVFRGRRGASK